MAKNRTLAFLGFGKKKAGEEGETDEEREAREQAEREKNAKASLEDDDDDDEEDEGDEDEEKAESPEEKKAVRRRNALRAAGHRRGVSAAHVRVAAIMNGIAPAQAEMAMHLALNTDLAVEQAKAAMAKAPQASGGGTPFARAMEHFKPPVGASGGGQAASPPSLAARMAATIKRQSR